MIDKYNQGSSINGYFDLIYGYEYISLRKFPRVTQVLWSTHIVFWRLSVWKNLIGAAALLGLIAGNANAAVVINAFEQGSDVIFSGTGSIDLTDAETSFPSDFQDIPNQIGPLVGLLTVNIGDLLFERYQLEQNIDFFGNSSGLREADSAVGDIFGFASGILALPGGYTSGDLLSFQMTFAGLSLGDLGMEAGTSFVATVPNDTITLLVGPSPVPVPAALPLLVTALGGLGLLSWRRHRKAFV